MKHIEINPDWFYHRATQKNFEKIIVSNGIKAKRQSMSPKELLTTKPDILWNGLWYISLAKAEDNISINNSSYAFFILGFFAFIIQDITPIKTKVNRTTLAKLWSATPSKIRYSLYEDEYQIKNEIPLDKIIGIKLPETSYIPSLFPNHQTEIEKNIHNFTTTMKQKKQVL